MKSKQEIKEEIEKTWNGYLERAWRAQGCLKNDPSLRIIIKTTFLSGYNARLTEELFDAQKNGRDLSEYIVKMEVINFLLEELKKEQDKLIKAIKQRPKPLPNIDHFRN